MTPSLHPLICTVCGRAFRGLARKPANRNVFCSQPCRNAGKRSYMRNLGVVPVVFTPTLLNITVTDAYQQCVADGTHRPGEQLTGIRTWKGYDAPMPICDVCSVPFRDESVSFRLSGSLSGALGDDEAA